MEAFIAWLPLLVLLGAVWWGYRVSMRRYKEHVDEVNTVNQKIVDTNQEMIAELREIKELLKRRS